MLKGVVVLLIGGFGNVLGVIVGSLLFGFVESYGVVLFGISYCDLFVFGLLIVFFVWWLNGLFSVNCVLLFELMMGIFFVVVKVVCVLCLVFVVLIVVVVVLLWFGVLFYVL